MKRFIAVTTCIITLTCIGWASVAHAVNESGQALEIAPPVINMTADPGEVKTANISLRDISSNPLVVINQINDFTSNGEDGIPKVMVDNTEPSPYSIKTWIDPLDELTLEPRQVKALPVTIRVPADAAPGGYYGVICFTAVAPGMTTTGVSLSASLCAMVFIRVNGDAKEAVTVEEFFTAAQDGKRSGLFESQPVTFAARVKNSGSVHEQPRGQIVVKDVFGNTVTNVNMNLDQRNILPGSIRKFEANMDKGNIGDRFLFGYYTAKVTLTYGSDSKTTTSTLSFWVIPWRMVLTLIVAIIALVIVIRVLIKRYTDRVVGRSRGSRRR